MAATDSAPLTDAQADLLDAKAAVAAAVGSLSGALNDLLDALAVEEPVDPPDVEPPDVGPPDEEPEGPAGPVEPPPVVPDDHWKVTDVDVEVDGTTLKVTAKAPEGATKLLVSWGYSGRQVGKVFLAPGAAEAEPYVITGLPAQTKVTVDILAARAGDTYDNLSRANVTVTTGDAPLSPGGDVVVPPIGGPVTRESLAGRRDAVIATAGARDPNLKPIASASDVPSAWPARWDSKAGSLIVTGRTTLAGYDVHGLVYVARGAADTVFSDLRCRGVQFQEGPGSPKFRRVTVVGNPRLALGQGAIHFYGQQGWEVEGCDISGFADGMQCVGPGLIANSYFHEFAFGFSPHHNGPTHNDGVQNYRGPVEVEHSVFIMVGRPGSTNGCLFSSNNPTAVFDAADCWFETTHPDTNCLHANTGRITARRSMAKGGRLIKNVQLLDGSVRE